MNDDTAWTSRQFANAMRKAGYDNIGQGCYIHKETGYKYMAWTFEDGAEAWKQWAAVRQTPPPF